MSTTEPRNQFTFYRSFYEGIAGLPKKDRAATLLAVCAYALYEEEPSGMSTAAKVAFELIRPVLDSGRKKAVSGKQGGSKPKANGKQIESKTEANGKQNASKREKEKDNDIDNDVDIDADVEGKGNASPMHTLGDGENVFLNEYERNVLISKMGQSAFERYVDRLSDFISRTGAKVYSHYETILRWWEEDRERPSAPAKKPDRNAQYQTHDGGLSELERAAVERALMDGEEEVHE